MPKFGFEKNFARFAIHKKKNRYVRTKDNSIKDSLFRPARKTPTSVSVFDIEGLEKQEIADLCEANVIPSFPGDTYWGFAKFVGKDVYSLGLSLVDDPPPDRHALIDGYPVDADEERLSLEQALAASSEWVAA